MEGECDFDILSLNVKGFGDKNKCISVLRWLKKRKHKIIFIQEAHCCKDVEKIWKREWEGNMIFSHGTTNSRGCMVLLSSYLDYSINSTKVDSNGRFIIINVQINGRNYNLINVYLPNTETEQVKFFKDFSAVLKKENIATDDNLIIGGDWNLVKDIVLDKSGGLVNLKQKAITAQRELMSSLELHDIWRIKNPNTKRYTWRQKNPFIQCRLDYFFLFLINYMIM